MMSLLQELLIAVAFACVRLPYCVQYHGDNMLSWFEKPPKRNGAEAFELTKPGDAMDHCLGIIVDHKRKVVIMYDPFGDTSEDMFMNILREHNNHKNLIPGRKIPIPAYYKKVVPHEQFQERGTVSCTMHVALFALAYLSNFKQMRNDPIKVWCQIRDSTNLELLSSEFTALLVRAYSEIHGEGLMPRGTVLYKGSAYQREWIM